MTCISCELSYMSMQLRHCECKYQLCAVIYAVAQQTKSMIPESPEAREAVADPLTDPSDIWRRKGRGVVCAGVVRPVPADPALSWRVRGPGALRRLRVLLRLDFLRRVGGGCVT